MIIDTVLVTGPMGNEEQKNISHETGKIKYYRKMDVFNN